MVAAGGGEHTPDPDPDPDKKDFEITGNDTVQVGNTIKLETSPSVSASWKMQGDGGEVTPTTGSGTTIELKGVKVGKVNITATAKGYNDATKTITVIDEPVTEIDVIATYNDKELARVYIEEERMDIPTLIDMNNRQIAVSATPADKVTSIEYSWDTGEAATISGSSGTIIVPTSFEKGNSHILYVTARAGEASKMKTYIVEIKSDDEDTNTEINITASANGKELEPSEKGIINMLEILTPIDITTSPEGVAKFITYSWDDETEQRIEGDKGNISVPDTFAPGSLHTLQVKGYKNENEEPAIVSYPIMIPEGESDTEPGDGDINAFVDGGSLDPEGEYEFDLGTPIDIEGTPEDQIKYLTYFWDGDPEQRIDGSKGQLTIPTTFKPGTKHTLTIRAYVEGNDQPIAEKQYIFIIPSLDVDVIATYEYVELAKPEDNPTAVEKGKVIDVSATPLDVTSIRFVWSDGTSGKIDGNTGTVIVPTTFEEGMTYAITFVPYVGDVEYIQKDYVIRIPTDFQINARHNGEEIPDEYNGRATKDDSIQLYAQPEDEVASIVYVWDNEAGPWETVPGTTADVTIPAEFSLNSTHKLYAYAKGLDGKTCAVKMYTFLLYDPSNPTDDNPLEVLPWEEENFDLQKLAIALRNDSQSSKANKNMYVLNEDVTYYVDFKNGGNTITDPVVITLNVPLEFEVIDNGGGEVDEASRTITWTYPEGMEKNYSGTKTVVLRYLAFSNPSYTSETIYPLATIGTNSSISDRSAVVNLIFQDSATELDIMHKQYMHGDANATTFRPDDTITRAEGALVLGRILLGQDVINNTTVSNAFPDLNETYLEAQKAITACTSYGIINGYTDGTYKPNRTMTRAEFMKILATFLEKDSMSKGVKGLEIKDIEDNVKLYNNPVSEYIVNGEVVTNHWAISQITLLARLNMTPVSASERDLRIDKGIKRAEVAQLVNYYLLRGPAEYDSSTYTGFSDVSTTHKLVGDILEATRNDHHALITENGTEVIN